MKKLLFIPMLFTYYMSIGQIVSSASIIGKSIRIENLVVAQNDFSNEMNWGDAKKACAKLGKGWRLPTKDELNTLYLNKDKIGGFADTIYWSSSEHDYYIDTVWFQYFSDGAQDDYGELGTGYVRAVRTF